MTQDEVTRAYGSKAAELADILGAVVSPRDPDRDVIEPWAETVTGRILGVGASTGRWSGHLAALGHAVDGLEPVDQFVEIARRTHPTVDFRHASIADLVGSEVIAQHRDPRGPHANITARARARRQSHA